MWVDVPHDLQRTGPWDLEPSWEGEKGARQSHVPTESVRHKGAFPLIYALD